MGITQSCFPHFEMVTNKSQTAGLLEEVTSTHLVTGQWLGPKEHVPQKIQAQSTLESVICPFPMPIHSWCPYINTFLVLCFLFFFMILFILDTFSCIVVHQHYFVFLHICTHICTLLCTYMYLYACHIHAGTQGTNKSVRFPWRGSYKKL